jgi:limonene-1,2-epoxide hydrolase
MRKNLFAMAASLTLGLAPLLAMAADAPATVPNSKIERDKENIGVVKAFIAGWNDGARGADYLSDQSSVRLEEDKPAVIGKKAYIDAWAMLQPGQHVTVKVHEIFARSPVVLTRRTDTLITPGKPDQSYEVVGVFIVKDKKIAEWTDYIHK